MLNVYLIKYDQLKDCKDFNVLYDIQLNIIKLVIILIVVLFDDKGGILLYGYEVEF